MRRLLRRRLPLRAGDVTMLGMVLLHTVVGAVIGMRFKVLFLGPAIIAGLLITTGVGVAAGWRCNGIVLAAFVTLAALQLGYLIGCVLKDVSSRARRADVAGSPMDSNARCKNAPMVRTSYQSYL
jgi:hypothetical protein